MNQAFQSPGQADKELWAVHSEWFHVKSELLGLSAMLSCQVAAQKNSATSVDYIVEEDPEEVKTGGHLLISFSIAGWQVLP